MISYTYQGPCGEVFISGNDIVAAPMTHYTLMGLEEFSTYDISVTAESNGMYSDSVSTSFTTMPSGTCSEYLYSHSN